MTVGKSFGWPKIGGDHWYLQGRAQYRGGNEVRLLRTGAELFPAMREALIGARHEVWLATYIFNDDEGVRPVLEALIDAAQRGVVVRVVVDGFGVKDTLRRFDARLRDAGVHLYVYRPVEGWRSWLQPEQIRRLHQKLCAIDGQLAFVGGINLIDDRYDLATGWTDKPPRLDYAVQLCGPIVKPVENMIHALAARVEFGKDWPEEIAAVARSPQPVQRARNFLRHLQDVRLPQAGPTVHSEPEPMVAAFVVRDNLRQRRTIELAYIEALRSARQRVDLVSPYFYPGRAFRRVLVQAARRGVRVRLLMQGRWDYVFAAMAARALYGDLQQHGILIYEYTPAALHAKVAVVDDDWATVGSSNIDPLSLLVNLEANVIVRDPGFVRQLADDLERAFAEATLMPTTLGSGWWAGLRAWVVATGARLYMKFAGVTRRY